MFASKDTLLTRPSGYQIQRSLRFRKSAGGYLSRTVPAASNRQTWTWSAWVKRGILGVDEQLFDASTSGTNITMFRFTSGDALFFYTEISGNVASWTTSALFRDPAAWYHVVLVVDTTQATASNRARIYVNGTLQTTTTSGTVAQNASLLVNSAITHGIGSGIGYASTNYFDGYLTEINFIDGQALTPSSFGAINPVTGVWSATRYNGTYGTNGFYLNFTDNSAATAATIGKDYSGNGNNWTPNNISVTAGVTYDSMLDAPLGAGGGERGNYCVLNPVDNIAGATFSNGNLQIVTGNTGVFGGRSTISVASGKWYWEMTPTSNVSGAECAIGIDSATTPITSSSTGLGYSATSYSMRNNGQKVNNSTASTYGSSYTDNDVIGVALDLDTGTLAYYKNGTSQGTAFSGISGTFTPAMSDLGGAQGVTLVANFGQRPFSYTPPTGFKALHTGNLAAPVIALPAQNMAATLWTGNGSSSRAISNTVNNVSFQPDWVWIKSRSNVRWHYLTDSVRGATKTIFSNDTSAEQTLTDALLSFNSGGFNIGSNTDVNANTNTFVAWQWKAGGTAVTNTAGSITSSVSANVSAGFSVVTYTGNGTAGATIGHGLGVALSMILVKRRDAVAAWDVYHSSIGATGRLYLNTTDATNTSSAPWNNTAPTSTVFTVGTASDTNQSSSAIVAYCFAPVAGYSAFGSYTGNGSTDGPFVFLGFRPKFVMVKRTDATGSWTLLDTSRSLYNVTDDVLRPNTSDAEFAGNTTLDVLSNGFKIRSTWSDVNTSSATYIYMAFAESPFKNSLAR